MTHRLLTIIIFGFVVGAASLAQGQITNNPTRQIDRNEPLVVPQTVPQIKQRLIEGNKRFVAGRPLHPHMTMRWRDRLAKQQKPFTTILGCSDSRVPIELLFDQGFGDLFVVRVAGNVVDPDVTGSVEYGVDHLNTKLVVVMGHESCGAVTAALSARLEKNQTRSTHFSNEFNRHSGLSRNHARESTASRLRSKQTYGSRSSNYDEYRI